MGAKASLKLILLLSLVAIVTGTALSGIHPTTKIYVTNSEGDDITVIDLASRKVTADIRVGTRPHGLCAPADGRTVFATIESEDVLKIIDTTNNKVVKKIGLTGRPNQCASTPDGHYVGVPIRNGNSIDIVDTRKGEIAKVLPVHVPHNGYDADNNEEMFVSSMGDHDIELIDLRKMEYVDKIPVGGVPRPYAVTKDGRTLYSALSGFHGFVIASISERKVIGRVTLPSAPPSACTLEPNTPTHGIALSPDDKELWVTSLADGGVYVYKVATKKLSHEIRTGKCPNWITFSPDGRYVAVSNSGSDDCSIIDALTRREVARVKVGKGPKRLLAVRVP
jgi:YVTN family beta-propeller protein